MRLGLGLTVFVELKVDSHTDKTAAAISEALKASPEVISAHIVCGPADFRLEIVVADLAPYERLLFGTLLKLPNVTDVRSDFVLRTVKAGAHSRAAVSRRYHETHGDDLRLSEDRRRRCGDAPRRRAAACNRSPWPRSTTTSCASRTTSSPIASPNRARSGSQDLLRRLGE